MKSEATSIVCTLFEGHYHYGVAALTNSLYARGFRSSIFAGYRGKLPNWCGSAYEDLIDGLPCKTLDFAHGMKLHFVKLKTDYHLTNYKPDFLLDIWNGPAKNAGSIFYIDPDIVLNATWKFFEDWTKYGVALCEDVNSPLAENHPRRAAWRQYYGDNDIQLSFKTTTYANGGFIGVSRKDKKFLATWKVMQEIMAPQIGGLSTSVLSADTREVDHLGPYAPFGKTDQDALNSAVEAWSGSVSFVGKEAMAIIPGASLLPHALGQPKPWRWNPLRQVIFGRPPRRADVAYWNHANGVVTAHSGIVVREKIFLMKVASFIGRFYKRR